MAKLLVIARWSSPLIFKDGNHSQNHREGRLQVNPERSKSSLRMLLPPMLWKRSFEELVLKFLKGLSLRLSEKAVPERALFSTSSVASRRSIRGLFLWEDWISLVIFSTRGARKISPFSVQNRSWSRGPSPK